MSGEAVAAVLVVLILFAPLGILTFCVAWKEQAARTGDAMRSILRPPTSSMYPYCLICALVVVPEPGVACETCSAEFTRELNRWGHGADS